MDKIKVDEIKKCSKCNGEMIKGEECSHIWKNADKKTFIGGTKYYTYACSKCGFMESYLEI